MAAAFDRSQARALAGGRGWRDRNTFFLLGDDEALGRVLRFAQWPAWIDPVLERVRRDPRLLEILAPLIGRDLKQIINQLHWKDRKSTRLNSSHYCASRMPSSALKKKL